MNGSLRIARVFGIPIEIHFTWLFVFGLITWSLAIGYFPRMGPDLSTPTVIALAITATLVFFAALLAHELAHAYVALREGLTVRRITLFIFGGVAQMGREPKTAGGEFRMALAGPLTSLLIGGACWLISRAIGEGGPQLLFAYLAFINVAVAVFNLLPAFPLDGGRVFRSALWYFTGNLARATRIATLSGQGFAYVFMALGVLQLLSGRAGGGIWLLFIGWFLLQAAQAGYQQVLIRSSLRGVEARDVMRETVSSISPGMTLADFVHGHLMRGRDTEFCVMDDGRLQGMISLDDVKRVPRERWDEATVGEVMTREAQCPTLRPSQSAYEAFLLLTREPASHIIVRDGDRLVGVINRADLLSFIRTRMVLEG